MELLCKTLGKDGRCVTVEGDTLTITIDGNRYACDIPQKGYWAFFRAQDHSVVRVDGEWIGMLRDAAVILRSCYHIENVRTDALATSWDNTVLLAGTIKEGMAQVVDAKLYNLQIFGMTHPAAVTLFKKWRARQTLLFSISPTDSLSSLEKQVDMLTRVVRTLITNKDAELLDAFLELASDSPEGLQKALAFKKSLREIQTEYREKKA